MTEPMNQPMQPPTSTGAPVGTATAAPPPPPEAAQLERLLFEVKKVIVGQDRAIERMLACMLAGGHCLLESVPGLAKTLSAETLATAVGGTFARIQFTPDLLPADVVGTRIYRTSTRSTVPLPRCSRRCSRSWPRAT